MKKQTFFLIIMLLFSLVLVAQSEKYHYPVPEKTNKLLFYIQRNHNENTIVYDAVFDSTGKLNPDKPVDAYWVRYQENSQRMELRTFEKWMVYGVNCKKVNNGYDYRIYLSASDKLVLWLKQTAPFKAEVIAEIGGEKFKLDHLFSTADESGMIPKILFGELFGYSLQDGTSVHKKVLPEEIK